MCTQGQKAQTMENPQAVRVHYSDNDSNLSPARNKFKYTTMQSPMSVPNAGRAQDEDEGEADEALDVTIRDIHDAGYAFDGDNSNPNFGKERSGRAGSGIRHEITVGCRNLPMDGKKKKPSPVVAVFEQVYLH
jgi:hypothetical protein